MTKEELLQFIKENLTVRMNAEDCGSRGTKVSVTLYLADEEISSDWEYVLNADY